MNEESPKDEEAIAEDATEEAAEQASDGDGNVLSDDEVGALLNGVSTGEVEISSSSGRQFAAVADFAVPARSRLNSKRLPNLDKLIERLAERIRIQVREKLQCRVAVTPGESCELPFESAEERNLEPVMAVQFSAAPLPGHGALLIEPELVAHLVESYFGGSTGAKAVTRGEGFTAGERRVTDQFVALVLESLEALWQPLQEIKPVVVKVEPSVHLLELAGEADLVVRSSLEFAFADSDSALHLFLPSKTIDASLPYLRGVDRKDDPAKDRLWRETIRSGLHNVNVGVEAMVGDVTMSLAELTRLQPGDVISIANPREAILRAQGTSLMQARFGVHAGRNAVEATAWLNGKR